MDESSRDHPPAPPPREAIAPARAGAEGLLDRIGLAGLLWRAVLVFVFAVYAYHIGLLLISPHGGFDLIRSFYLFNVLCLPPLLAAAGGVVWLGGVRGIRWGRIGPWRRVSSVLIAAGVLLGGAGVYATFIEPARLRVRRVAVATPKLAAPLRLLHVSDIQAERVGEYERRAFAMMAALRPDLVVVTGDLLQPTRPATFDSELPKMAALLDSLRPPLGIFFVEGDVDYPIIEPLLGGLGGMRTLRGEGVVLNAAGGRIRLLGLESRDSHNDAGVRRHVKAWLDGAAPGDLIIVAGHAPDYVLSTGDLPIDLCLAGHTHGGQLRVPWFGPIITLSHVPRAWALGYRAVGRTRINVSGGVGCEHIGGIPSLRINCPPEMTLIELRPPVKP
ncbi:MAG: metallophosphoesterase [bacterium]|nr:metallophosphoesterase [bacterium]